jgi:nitrate reductase NapE component
MTAQGRPPDGEGAPTTGHQPAAPAPPVTEAGKPHWIVPPKRLDSIAWAAYTVLAFSILVNLAYMVVSLIYADAVQTQIDERSLSLQEASDIEDAFAIVGIVYLVSVIAGAVGFIVWFYRAYSNVPATIGRPARFGRGWSIGAWFVPILNFWRPKQIGNDIWRAGDPDAIGNELWYSLRVSQLLHWWWVLYLLAGIVGGIGTGLLSTETVLSNSVTGPGVDPLIGVEPPTDSELRQEYAAAIIFAISSTLEVVAAVLAISFVTKASDRQDAMISPGRAPEAAA